MIFSQSWILSGPLVSLSWIRVLTIPAKLAAVLKISFPEIELTYSKMVHVKHAARVLAYNHVITIQAETISSAQSRPPRSIPDLPPWQTLICFLPRGVRFAFSRISGKWNHTITYSLVVWLLFFSA